jgi:hypothetical protein
MFTAATVQANAVPPISEMNSKQLGLLHQLLDRDARFAVLINPGNPQIRSPARGRAGGGCGHGTAARNHRRRNHTRYQPGVQPGPQTAD